MAKFTPFDGKGLAYYSRVAGGGSSHGCIYCGKKFKKQDQFEEHWPKCTGVCKEKPFRPFPLPLYPRFPSSFK
ncbi:hypothetical protein IWQ56_004677 [Coemansia nantahalensis]|uniref:Uncharacterized protein n=2 Tax=Coemansia TaxID=4863 RepID=A0ACC1KJP3_9FUNG|nr:hypothetical protein IWQ57_006202 [Coemansia nantahalensis]KAJ2763916.1 hypothetical protein IWQ56_004677 [Coemansia nantahalensis]KAJ2790883.1 hypothetical protein H4R21_006422 [Coemansia helicoidea]